MRVTPIVLGGEGEERHFCLKTRLRTFLEIKFFCMTVWRYSASSKREDLFLRIFLKILGVNGRGDWRHFCFTTKSKIFLCEISYHL